MSPPPCHRQLCRFVVFLKKTHKQQEKQRKTMPDIKTRKRFPMFEPQVILAVIFTVCFNVYMAPPGTTFENSKFHLRRIGLILVGMFVLDRVVAQRSKAPWMLLHAVTNLVIAVSCIPDLLEIAKDPIQSCHGK